MAESSKLQSQFRTDGQSKIIHEGAVKKGGTKTPTSTPPPKVSGVGGTAQPKK